MLFGKHEGLLPFLSHLLQRQLLLVAAPFLRLPAPGIIEQDVTHGLRRYREEMSAARPLRLLLNDQLEVGFVDEGGCVERVVALPV